MVCHIKDRNNKSNDNKGNNREGHAKPTTNQRCVGIFHPKVWSYPLQCDSESILTVMSGLTKLDNESISVLTLASVCKGYAARRLFTSVQLHSTLVLWVWYEHLLRHSQHPRAVLHIQLEQVGRLALALLEAVQLVNVLVDDHRLILLVLVVS